MSVYGLLALAKALTTGGSSFGKGLADLFKDQEEQKRKTQELVMQQNFQRSTLQQQLDAQEKQLWERWALDSMSKAAQSGYVSPEEMAGAATAIRSGAGTDDVTYLLAQGSYRKRVAEEMNRNKELALAYADKASAYITDPEQKQKLADAAAKGDTATVLSIMTAARVPFNVLAQQKAAADVRGAEATAGRQEVALEYDKATLVDRIKKAGLENVLTEEQIDNIAANTDNLRQQMDINLEKWGVQKDLLEQDKVLKDLAVEKTLLDIAYARETNPDKARQIKAQADKLEQEITTEGLRQRLLKAQTERQELANKGAEKDLEAYDLKLSADLLSKYTDLALRNPEAALKAIESNKDQLEKLGIDAASFENIAGFAKTLRKYKDPKRSEAVDIWTRELDAPPDDRSQFEAEAERVKQYMVSAGVDEQAAEEYKDILLRRWGGMMDKWELDRAMARAQMERYKMPTGSSGGDNLQQLDLLRKTLNDERANLSAAMDSVENKMRTEDCYSPDGITIMTNKGACAKYAKELESIRSDYNKVLTQQKWLADKLGAPSVASPWQPLIDANKKKGGPLTLGEYISLAQQSGLPTDQATLESLIQSGRVLPEQTQQPTSSPYEQAKAEVIAQIGVPAPTISQRAGAVPQFATSPNPDVVRDEAVQRLLNDFYKKNGRYPNREEYLKLLGAK